MNTEILLIIVVLELAVIAVLAFKVLRTLSDTRDALDSFQALVHERSMAVVDGMGKLIGEPESKSRS